MAEYNVTFGIVSYVLSPEETLAWAIVQSIADMVAGSNYCFSAQGVSGTCMVRNYVNEQKGIIYAFIYFNQIILQNQKFTLWELILFHKPRFAVVRIPQFVLWDSTKRYKEVGTIDVVTNLGSPSLE